MKRDPDFALQFTSDGTSQLASQRLTKREIEVIERVVQFSRIRIAAEELCITEKSCKTHLTNIYRKLKLKSKHDLLMAVMPLMKPIEKKLDPNVLSVGLTSTQASSN